MADSIENSILRSYFCYHCDQQLSIPPSFLCPVCSKGFLEEIIEYSDIETSDEESNIETSNEETELNLLEFLSIENSRSLVDDNTEFVSSGLCKEQIKLLPIISLFPREINKESQCTICIEDFIIGERVKCLPCDHFYHETCITQWLEKHPNCPKCRKIITIEIN